MIEGSEVAFGQVDQVTAWDKLLTGCDLASPKLGNNRQKPNLPQGCVCVFWESLQRRSPVQQPVTAITNDEVQTKLPIQAPALLQVCP